MTIYEKFNNQPIGNSLLTSYSSLYYCSEINDPNCGNKFLLNILVEGQGNPLRYDYKVENAPPINARLDKVEIRLFLVSEENFENDFFLYSDSNNNGKLDEKDNKIARSYLTGKKIIFEDINYKIRSEEVSIWKVISSENNFFIVYDSDNTYMKRSIIKELNVDIVNLSDNNQYVRNRSAMADLSLFNKIDLKEMSKNEFLDKYDIFKSGDNDQIILTEGIYQINETVIIPEDLFLIIEPGVTIEFGEDSNLISYSPALIEGREENLITFKPLDNAKWGVVGIIGNSIRDESTLVKYAKFEGGSETEVNGAYLSGMLSVYRNNRTVVSNCVFTEAKADDALNIKYSDVNIFDNRFIGNSADAIDGDFITGNLHSNYFESNGNDSLDFSGSDVEVYLNNLLSSGDKGVSVGEKTKAYIYNNWIEEANIGVEIKDSSDAFIEQNIIIESATSGINSYVKKSFFGEPKVDYINNIILGGNNKVAGLVNSSLLDGNYISGDLNKLIDLLQFDWTNNLIRE